MLPWPSDLLLAAPRSASRFPLCTPQNTKFTLVECNVTRTSFNGVALKPCIKQMPALIGDAHRNGVCDVHFVHCALSDAQRRLLSASVRAPRTALFSLPPADWFLFPDNRRRLSAHGSWPGRRPAAGPGSECWTRGCTAILQHTLWVDVKQANVVRLGPREDEVAIAACRCCLSPRDGRHHRCPSGTSSCQMYAGTAYNCSEGRKAPRMGLRVIHFIDPWATANVVYCHAVKPVWRSSNRGLCGNLERCT